MELRYLKNSLIICFILTFGIISGQSVSDVRYYLNPIENKPIYKIFDTKLKVNIQSKRTQINVRNTYKLSKSKVIAQVNGDERYNVTKIAEISGSELLILGKDFISNDYYLNGIKKKKN